MAYRQKYTPNLNVPAQRGWCLKYIDDAGKAPKRSPSAQAAYNVEKAAGHLKSPAIAPPVGIWAVGFLAFTRGQYTSLGHVFFIKNLGGGRYDIRDSETRSGARKPYGNINELISWFGAYAPRYTGWSGWCDGRQYIEAVAVPKPPTKIDEIKKLYLEILGRPADAGGIRTYLKFPLSFVRAALLASPEYRRHRAATKAVYYTVRGGDTVSGIAVKYKTTIATIKKLNNLKDVNKISAGQKLRIK